MASQTKPAAAFFASVGPFTLGDNGENAKSAPFSALARSLEPMPNENWYGGQVVHDFAGMLGRSRVAIDYCHDPKEVIGYGNRIEAGPPMGLTVAGALTPYKDDDRASEIISKSRAGVPYEASIDWRGDCKIEEVPAGRTAWANGRQYAGPVTIFREWTFRGLAICPHGMDMYTSAYIASSPGEFPYTVVSGDTHMAEPVKASAEAASPAAVDAKPVPPATEAAAPPAAVDAAPVPPVPPATEAAKTAAVDAAQAAQPPEAPGKRFLAAFGDLGGKYFAEGLSFEQAQAAFASHQAAQIAALTTEVGDLKTRLAQARPGEKQAAPFQPPDPPNVKKPKGQPLSAAVASLADRYHAALEPAAQ